MIFLRLIIESLSSAFDSLRSNKLRTILSLTGITIGIFTIITVFTAIDALQGGIKQSIDKLGSNMVYVQKWPWLFGGNYPWWKYVNRPLPEMDEAERINSKSKLAEIAVFAVNTRKTVKYKDQYLENVDICAHTNGYPTIRSFEMYKGRFYTDIEGRLGKKCAVLGYETALNLFEKNNPLGAYITIAGHKVKVIGVFEKEGEDEFGNSHDQQIVIPINYAKSFIDLRKQRLNPSIMVKAKDNVSSNELIDELQGVMRSVRRLKPSEDDNFALNKSTMITEGIQPIFVVLDLVGIIIGGFSILVGGFGIANIMFVSVKEQTRQIGIQKALGAKKYFILLHFLFEAIALSLLGAIGGIILIWFIISVINLSGLVVIGSYYAMFNVYDGMQFSLSAKNVFIGLSISVVVGIVAGLFPARKAASLDPVVAINALS